MINEVNRLCLKKILSLKNVLFINLYVIFGAFMFANNYANCSYGFMFIKTLTNKNFFLIFVFPIIISLVIKHHNFYYSNNFFVLRMKSKKNLFKYNFITGIIIILYYYINVILCTLIVSNIIIHTPLSNNSLGYNVSDFVIVVYYSFKLLIYMISVYMLILILIYTIQNLKLVICISIAIILYLNLGSSAILTKSMFDISKYIMQLGYTKIFLKDLKDFILFNLLLYPIFITILNIVGVRLKNIGKVE